MLYQELSKLILHLQAELNDQKDDPHYNFFILFFTQFIPFLGGEITGALSYLGLRQTLIYRMGYSAFAKNGPDKAFSSGAFVARNSGFKCHEGLDLYLTKETKVVV